MDMADSMGVKRTLAWKVADELRRQIEGGDYAPGDKLPIEPVLVEKFGFSRTVIREAIAALRADGLLESRHGVGVFVLGPKQTSETLALFTDATDKISDIIEELELRIGIEVEAAGLAALRSSPAQEAEIQAQLDIFAQLVARGESTDDADFQFHMAIATATNNVRFKTFLEHIGRRIIPRVKFRKAMGGIDPLPNRDRILLAEHTEVVDAILARDPDQARDAMRRHLLGGIKRYRGLASRKPV
ncbi:FadR/GntR family transcriptional regulator [Phyllobacterium zundukense]|jgi:DNA-binding FadR family transcriptional regulator|uniref:FadR family transcriptional regulator n=1 Tax=Phyllobacterium zundukense TaxID=1867719 RepID=A0ACD4DA49_9HYPH|nr:FadR/GntR family transcriptional regulator [Phyllobacterium zundukense]UXN62545.1 FadR family transcriptional regulator [Phyllobacterium zundukense]